MEAAVKETILTHLKRNSLLSTRQFGFLGGRSTILQLLTFLDKCVDAISRGNVTDVVYLDFQKAFDTVPHKWLMVKLQAYGISGDILNWINAFLDGRTQRVIVNGIASREEAVLSSVPQGSVLGPLLFVVYINDLPDTLVGNCMMFADDTKSFREITDVADMNMMQNDLHLMEKWSKTWLLKFHPEKCVVMSVGIWWNIIQAYPYELLSTGLEHVLEEKDLGIIIDSELTFEAHIEAKLGTANQMLGLIRRSLTCCTAEIVIPLYKAFVRQHLVVVVCPFQPSSSVNSGCPGTESSILVSSRWACPISSQVTDHWGELRNRTDEVHPVDPFHSLDILKNHSASVAFCRNLGVYNVQNGAVIELSFVVSVKGFPRH